MQRHGQQRRYGEDPPPDGRDLDRPGGQRREQQQVGQPPQRQRRGEAQVQQVRQEHRRPAGKVKQRVLVGLQLGIFLVAVKVGVGGGEQGIGEFLPGEHRGVLILQGGVHVGHPAETGGGGHVAHLPVLIGEEIGPPAGQGETLVDVVFFIGGGIGGQHEGVEEPQPQHQREHQPVQPHAAAQHRPDRKGRQQRREPADEQEEAGQIPADALPGHLHGHGAVHRRTVHGHRVLPEGRAVAVADGQHAAARVMGRQGERVAPPFGAGHGPVQPQHGVLVGHDVFHHAGGAGQFFAGIGVGQHQFQLAGRLIPGQVKFHAHGQQVPVKGEGLAGRLAVLQNGGRAEIVADGLGPAFAQFGAHQRQPHQQRGRQQHHQRAQRPQQRLIRFFQFGCAPHTSPLRFNPVSRQRPPARPRSSVRLLAGSSARPRVRRLRRRAGGRCSLPARG